MMKNRLFVQIEQEQDFHKQVFPYSVPFGLKCEASKTGGVEVVSPFTIMIRIITNMMKNHAFCANCTREGPIRKLHHIVFTWASKVELQKPKGSRLVYVPDGDFIWSRHQ